MITCRTISDMQVASMTNTWEDQTMKMRTPTLWLIRMRSNLQKRSYSSKFRGKGLWGIQAYTQPTIPKTSISKLRESIHKEPPTRCTLQKSFQIPKLSVKEATKFAWLKSRLSWVALKCKVRQHPIWQVKDHLAAILQMAWRSTMVSHSKLG